MPRPRGSSDRPRLLAIGAYNLVADPGLLLKFESDSVEVDLFRQAEPRAWPKCWGAHGRIDQVVA